MSDPDLSVSDHRPKPGHVHVSIKKVFRGRVQYVGKMRDVLNQWGIQVPATAPRNHILVILEWTEPNTGQLCARVLASTGESFSMYEVSPLPDHPEIPC